MGMGGFSSLLQMMQKKRLMSGAAGSGMSSDMTSDPEWAPGSIDSSPSMMGGAVDFGDIGQVGESEPDPYQDLASAGTPAQDAYRQHIRDMPMQEAPSRGRGMLAVGAAALGALGNHPDQGIAAGQGVLAEPYQRKISDWSRKGKALESEAKFENESYKRKLDIRKAMTANEDRDSARQQTGFLASERLHQTDARDVAADSHRATIEGLTRDRDADAAKNRTDSARHRKVMEGIAQQNASTNAGRRTDAQNRPGKPANPATADKARKMATDEIRRRFPNINRQFFDPKTGALIEPQDEQGRVHYQNLLGHIDQLAEQIMRGRMPSQTDAGALNSNFDSPDFSSDFDEDDD